MANTTEAPKVREPRGRKPLHPPARLAARLKAIRREAGVSEEAVGAQGFVSTPG